MASKNAKEALGIKDPTEAIEGQEVLPGWEVTPESASQLMPYTPAAASQWRRQLRPEEILIYIKDLMMGRLAEDDPRAVMEILGQVARATTFEELVSGEDTVKGREILDTILRVEGYRFTHSQHEKGCPYYVLLDAVDTRTNEPALVSVGGWKLVGTCAALHYYARELEDGSPYLVPKGTPKAIEYLPYPHFFKIKKEKTAAGFDVNLITLPTA